MLACDLHSDLKTIGGWTAFKREVATGQVGYKIPEASLKISINGTNLTPVKGIEPPLSIMNLFPFAVC